MPPLKPRIWFLISLLCFLGALVCIHLGRTRTRPAAEPAPALVSPSAPATPVQPAAPLLSITPYARLKYAASNAFPEEADSPYPNRLRNSDVPLERLIRSDAAVLLVNASLNMERDLTLAVPPALRPSGDVSSYVIQSRGKVSEPFRKVLEAAGAQIVSYVPNNAYLVRLTSSQVASVAASPLVQGVVPWIPYFKLSPPLLAQALDASVAPSETTLNLLAFPGEADTTLKQIASMGFRALSRSRSPFGEQIQITANTEALSALARMEQIQWMEASAPRALMNDLTGVILGTSTNYGKPADVQYLGLTGQGIKVNVTDTGVKPALASAINVEYIDEISKIDIDGHGTHVAGIIAGNGLGSPTATDPADIPGSSLTPDFHGKAPNATIVPLPIDPCLGPLMTDVEIQEAVATNTIHISNNSWGYPAALTYDISAASFDAAVRDSLPLRQGEQPVTFVFAAGNEGQGEANGKGGAANTISSPGTAKNVITVGAIESRRRILTGSTTVTNDTETGETTTTYFFYEDSDSSNQVARYSSRGNVGIGLEGDVGRFKPDVIAPGSWIISTRAEGWQNPKMLTTNEYKFVKDQTASGNSTNYYQLIPIPDDGISMVVRVLPNGKSASPFPPLLLWETSGNFPPPADHEGTNFVRFPLNPSDGFLYVAVVNTNPQPVFFDLLGCIIHSNSVPPEGYFEALGTLNDKVAPNYRYESGTSMAAPAISGMLALAEEMFTKKLNLPTPSPALFKAMLINGTRRLSPEYDRANGRTLNLHGWGRPLIEDMIPQVVNFFPTDPDKWPIVYIDQGTTNAPSATNAPNALATGEQHVRLVTIDPAQPEALDTTLKVTLVWTDPPGNPSVGVKLVNDLDLIVTNLTTGEIFHGNSIPFNSIFNSPSLIETNGVDPGVDDVVNNVENVFIDGPLTGGKFAVSVHAKRVNVNAVTGHTNGIVQDYALVISLGNTSLTNALQIQDATTWTNLAFIKTQSLSNNVSLLKQRVGANTPLNASTNGTQSQWNFFTFTHPGGTDLKYVLVSLDRGDNLSVHRLKQADLDLYVSTDPTLLDLDPGAIGLAAASGPVSANGIAASSRIRSASESVLLTNSTPGITYYIAVKSEDQEAGEYDITASALSSIVDPKCLVSMTPNATPALPVSIPDGQNSGPGFVEFRGTLRTVRSGSQLVRKVTVNLDMTHQDYGDLSAVLKSSSSEIQATLFGHSFPSDVGGVPVLSGDPVAMFFDDEPYQLLPGAIHSEGKGLLAFGGQLPSSLGMLRLLVQDNALLHTGIVERASVCVELDCPPGDICPDRLCAGEGRLHYARVGLTQDKLEICIHTNNGPLEIYVNRGPNPPTTNDWEYFQEIPAGGGCLVIDEFSSPPILPGLYTILVFNSGNACVDFGYSATASGNKLEDRFVNYVYTNGPINLVDDALKPAVLNVATNGLVLDARVGVRLDHPRVSDLTLHLVSPQGTRWLLGENRGAFSPDGLGATFGIPGLLGTPEQILTNYSWVTFTDREALADNVFKFQKPPFRANHTGPNPALFESFFETVPQRNYIMAETVEGWLVVTNTVAVTNDYSLGSLHSNVLALSSSTISATVPMKGERQYQFSFAYRRESSSPTQQVTFPVGPLLRTGYVPAAANALTIDPAVVAPKLRLEPGQEVVVTVPRTELVGVAAGQFVTAMGDNSGVMLRGVPRFALVGQWSYSASLLSTQTAWGQPFFVGTNAVLRAPTDPGDYYLWLAINDLDYRDNSGSFPVTIRWKPAQLNRLKYQLAGVDQWVFPKDYWQTNTIRFLGRADFSDIVFSSDWNTTTLLDDVRLYEPISAAYYLAEEPLPEGIEYNAQNSTAPLQEITSIKGETTAGDWRLQLTDRRALPAEPVSQILYSWYLQILFAPPQRAIALTNYVEFQDLLRRRQVRYYSFDVPKEATRVTNTVVGDVEVFFNPTNYPDFNLDGIANKRVLSVDPSGSGDLLPGSRFYVAVRNVDPTVRSNAYTIRIDAELPIRAFTNGVPAALAAANALGTNFAEITTQFVTNQSYLGLTNILYPGTNMQWYRYDVESLPGLFATTFELHSTNTDLHLVARRSLPGVEYLPTPTLYDYHSINFDLTNEVIIVHDGSFPVRITPTPWLLGVYNSGTNSGWYSVSAARWTNVFTPSAAPFVTNALPSFTIETNWVNVTNEVGFRLAPGKALNYFYRFQSHPTNAAVLFELLSLSGDADLRVRRNDLPSPYLYDLSDLQLGTNSEHVAVSTNIYLPSFGEPTNWFINVLNQDSITVTGVLRVATSGFGNILVSSLPLELDPVGIAAGGGLIIRWRGIPGQKYEVRVSSNPLGPFDTVIATIIATTSTPQYTDPNPPPPPIPRFYRVIQVP